MIAKIRNTKETRDWVYNFCGYPKSQKWPAGVSVSAINKRLREYEFFDDDDCGWSEIPPAEQKEHFSQLAKRLGGHILSAHDVPAAQMHDLWQMVCQVATIKMDEYPDDDLPIEQAEVIFVGKKQSLK